MKLASPTQIFVLRCWQVHREGQWKWQFRLEIPPANEVYTFASLMELMSFLEQRLLDMEGKTRHNDGSPEK